MLFVNMAAITGVFSGVVLVHEAGHFLAARRCGVHVAEFSIGFPGTPVLVTYWRHNGTAFTLRALPFGGFVRFGAARSIVMAEGLGDDSATADETGENDGGFEEIPSSKKAAILVAGSLSNLVTGGILMVAATMTMKGLGLVDAATAVLGLMGMVTGETFSALVHLHVSDVFGPVGAAGVIQQALKKGIWSLLGIAGLMSCSVGLVNMLPLPSFDGWHLLVTGVETVRGQRLSWQFLAVATVAGYVGIIALMVAVTYQDVLRLLHGAL